MPQANPYSAYEKTKVGTADQRQLIVMLYDGAIRFLRKAEAKIGVNDIEAAHNYLIRARDIVSELLATLKPERAGEVGRNLERLYVYIFNRLVEANLTKDQAIVGEVIGLLTTLREGWAQLKPAGEKKPAEPGREKSRVSLRR